MNKKVTFNITKEETVNVLKTILIFLDSLNLTQTSKILQDECSKNGYLDVNTEIQPKVEINASSVSQGSVIDSKKLSDVELWKSDKYHTLETPVIVKPKENLLFYCVDFLNAKQSSKSDFTIQKHQRKKSTTIKKSQNSYRSFSGNCLDRETSIQNRSIFKSRSHPFLNFADQEPISNPTNLENNYLDPQLKNYKKLKQNFRMLESEHQKLMNVTTELTAALQTYIMGQTQNLNETLNKCKILYPELFNSDLLKLKEASQNEKETDLGDSLKNLKLVVKATDVTVEKNSEPLPTPETTAKNVEANETHEAQSYKLNEIAENYTTISYLYTDNYCDLDYKEIKDDLLAGNDELKVILLQALRTQITQSSNEVRAQFLQSYVCNDIFDLQQEQNFNKKLLTEIYFANDLENSHLLQEELSRLMNALASLTTGRNYLCQSETFLSSLLLILFKDKISLNISEPTRDMLIATVQKLSLRHLQRICMINSGLVEHILLFLSNNHSNISNYCMEYTTALLMNLCLHKSARQRLHPYAAKVVELLVNLLDDKYNFCISYVNGTMYSLLSDQVINEKARKINLSKLLEYHISCAENQPKTELQHVLRLHLNGSEVEASDCDSNIESNVEVDILEPELDNQVSKETVNSVISKYMLTSARPTEQSLLLDEKSIDSETVINENKKPPSFPEISYCEETKQYYHTPTKDEIFEQQRTRRLHRVAPLLTKPNSVIQRANSINKFCRYCHRHYSKPPCFLSKGSTSLQNSDRYFGICYRDQYINRNRLLRENKYSCECYNIIRQGMNLPAQEDDQNKTGHVKSQFSYCPRCSRSDVLAKYSEQLEGCSQSCIVVDNRITDDAVADFSLQELSKALQSEEVHICSCQNDCHCYDVAFQSRPKLLRTPPYT